MENEISNVASEKKVSMFHANILSLEIIVETRAIVGRREIHLYFPTGQMVMTHVINNRRAIR